jgi:hypothetical protein
LIQTANAEAEERRLMPRYVEQHFVNAVREVGLRIEARADGLYRVEHVLADLRSDRLAAVRRLGKPESSYRKVTFHKEHLEMDQHIDAVLIGPGHPLYAAVDERLNEMLGTLTAGVGVFVDTTSDTPYKLHFFEMAIRGQNTKGEVQTLLGELVAVREELSNTEPRFSVIPADTLLDLPAHPAAPENLVPEDASPAGDFLKSTYQTERRTQCQQERQHFVQVCRDYLQRRRSAGTWIHIARSSPRLPLCARRQTRAVLIRPSSATVAEFSHSQSDSTQVSYQARLMTRPV